MKEFLLGFLAEFAYAGLVGVLLAAGLGLPIPEDIPLMIGGLLSARGVTNAYLVFLFAYVAILAGDFFIFSMGRRLGPAALKKPWAQKLLTHKRQRVLKRHFLKYGPLTIVAARHMAGLRAPCFLMAGVARMSPIKFIIADGFGACLSVPLFIWVGYKFGENLDAILAWLKEAQQGVTVALVVGGIAFFVIRRWWRNRQTPAAPGLIAPTTSNPTLAPVPDTDLTSQEIRQVGVALEAEGPPKAGGPQP